MIASEVAFWRSEDSANPDREILAALRPGLATMPGALLLDISTPHARRGEVWRAFREHWGREGSPVLVWQAPTRTMNPTIPAAVLERARAEDPVAARAEFQAEFRLDLEACGPSSGPGALSVRDVSRAPSRGRGAEGSPSSREGKGGGSDAQNRRARASGGRGAHGPPRAAKPS